MANEVVVVPIAGPSADDVETDRMPAGPHLREDADDFFQSLFARDTTDADESILPALPRPTREYAPRRRIDGQGLSAIRLCETTPGPVRVDQRQVALHPVKRESRNER